MASTERTQDWLGTLSIKRRDVGLNYGGQGREGGVGEREGKTNRKSETELSSQNCYFFCGSHVNVILVNTHS